jgi:hypothetical protein
MFFVGSGVFEGAAFLHEFFDGDGLVIELGLLIQILLLEFGVGLGEFIDLIQQFLVVEGEFVGRV